MPRKKKIEQPAPETATAQPPQPDPRDAEIVKLQQDLASAKDQLLRALAETDNTRKRFQKEMEETSKYAITKFAGDLTEVLENLYRTEENIPADKLGSDETIKHISESVKLTKSELLKTFDKYGIKRISPVGEAFDHNFHQAIMQVEDNTVEAGKVVKVIQAGYTIQGRLLKPAMVAVAKSKTS